MSVGAILLNVALIALVPSLLWALLGRNVGRALARGALAAVLVLSVFIAIRTQPATLAAVFWAIMVAAAEEPAKFTAVRGGIRGRPGADGLDGLAVGVGFATVEHLLYALAGPRVVIFRLFTAGFLHAATGYWYAQPARDNPNRPAGVLTLTSRLLAATALHALYNLVLQGLDRNLTF